MSLTIDRLHSRFHSSQPLPARRRDEWLGAFAAADGDALGAGLVGDDEWLFIAQLPVAMRWSLDADATAVGENWQRQLRAAIEQALASGDDTQLIRYRSRTEAFADLLYRSALGERRRQWVWQRMGLIAHADGSAEQALAAGLASLVGEPAQVWPVLHRLLAAESETAALSALLRALPTTAWSRLFAASPRTAAYAAVADLAGGATASVPAPASAVATAVRHALSACPQARDLLHWAATRGRFAARHREPLSVLLAALAWSAAGTPAAALRERLLAVRGELAAAIGAADAAAVRGLHRSVEQTAAEPGPGSQESLATAETASAISEPEALPALPQAPESIDWHDTEWGGSLFWLGRFAAAGALDWLAARPELPPDALPLLLRATADALGLPDNEPAREAFCGGQLAPGEVSPVLGDYAATLVAAWSAWLDEAAPELAVPRLQAVCRRRGRIRFESGWIELLLPLNAVDTSIRRLGLDLDPGWLPWLACVIRIRYE
ncbi:hypothetical protein [Accumulibacter sp.]|uniref:hypothetical protein n=1 Tax=Accumulibacter sp. TaxID=2053492 RepID=UPI0028C44E74|nr:hypothetical protein [Accumulibacter sp.]